MTGLEGGGQPLARGAGRRATAEQADPEHQPGGPLMGAPPSPAPVIRVGPRGCLSPPPRLAPCGASHRRPAHGERQQVPSHCAGNGAFPTCVSKCPPRESVLSKMMAEENKKTQPATVSGVHPGLGQLPEVQARPRHLPVTTLRPVPPGVRLVGRPPPGSVDAGAPSMTGFPDSTGRRGGADACVRSREMSDSD